MIITKNAVFLHIQKTAGTWIRKALEPIMLEYHTHGILSAPRKHVFTFVRNPWDWYSSYYQFHQNGSDTFDMLLDKSPLISALPERTFSSFIENANDPTPVFRQQVRLRALMKCDLNKDDGLNEVYGVDYHHPHRLMLCDWANTNVSYYQHVYNLYTQYATQVGTVENVHADLISMLQACGELTDDIEAAILSNVPTNVTHDRKHYRDCYTDELIDCVARNNQEIISTYGYKF